MVGHKQTKATRKKIARSVTGKNNGMWKDGRRAYRRIAGAKPGDGKVVHHRNGDSKDNRKSNLKKMPKAQHERIHQRGKNFHKSGGRKKVPRGYVSKT